MSSPSDVRDVLRALPFPPDDGTRYALTDLFTVRAEIISLLDSDSGGISSVFEFGALRGFFLVTAYYACDWLERVGWVDNETHTPGSNAMCWANIREFENAAAVPDIDAVRIDFWTDRADVTPGRYDLVQVDSDHSYQGCLADLDAAALLDPRWVMVDDWTSDHHREEVQAATRAWLDSQPPVWTLTEHETVNGLALLTRRPA